MAKNKMKSHRGACKRFKLTGSGKVKRNKAYKGHILTKKTAKRKRGLRKATVLTSADLKARVKKGLNAHKRHKKVLKLAKGFYGQKSKVYRAAKPAVMRALRSSYIGRKNKKREYRRLWIARINAAARLNDISYSKLMNGLRVAGIEINRKMLSEMAIYDAAGFTKLCEVAKTNLK